MNAGDERRSTHKLKIPIDLYEEIGSQEKTIRLIKIGLLTLKVSHLEQEIADLMKRTEHQKKKTAELPCETERFQQLLEEALQDGKTLEKLLGKKR